MEMWGASAPDVADEARQARAMRTELLTSLPCANILYMLFWIPAILWTSANAELLAVYARQGAEPGEVIRTVNLFLIVLWPCIALTGPANAGISRIIREWLRNRSCHLISTFFRGLRENWKASLLLSAITGALPLIFWSCYCSLAQWNGGVAEAVYVFLLIQLLLWLLVTQLAYPMMVRFELPLRGLIRNSFLLTLMKFPSSLMTFVLAWIVPIGIAVASAYAPSGQPMLLLVLVLYYLMAGGCVAQYLFSHQCERLSRRYLMPKSDS